MAPDRSRPRRDWLLPWEKWFINVAARRRLASASAQRVQAALGPGRDLILAGQASGLLMIALGFPTLAVDLATGISAIGWALLSMIPLWGLVMLRIIQAKRLNRSVSERSPTDPWVVQNKAAEPARHAGRRERVYTVLFLVGGIYLGVPGLALAGRARSYSGQWIASVILCVAAMASAWMGLRRLRRLRQRRRGEAAS